ncbi:Protein of unknown function [Parapedobacter composti]|uniref:DUF4199 domain-containing protein n=1 Tax=Parapedobacter composti TaxID=623281 RepID=A0A1I1KHW4_9SPHI|nr:DUF4199 domain-containing protein [Parapedobacter composti]SFC60584.1 Protein of unknown function [Parapedobacter composti]
MEQQTLESRIKKEGASLGVSFGIIMAVIGILTMYWLVSSSSFIVTSFGSIVFVYIIPLIIGILFCIRLRKNIGGYWTFKQALVGIFVMFLVSWALSTAVGLVFERFIEPDIRERMLMNVQNNLITFLENQQVPDEDIDKATASIDQAIEGAANMTWGQQFKSYAIMIIVQFVVAMIFAAIFKRNPPMFAVYDETTDNDSGLREPTA